MPEGKIMKALSGFYYVQSGDKIVQCRGRGVFRKNKISPLVGDYVVYQADNEKEGYILEIKPRINELIRPSIANVEQAILVFSAVEPDFSSSLLDRFLVLVEAKGIKPLICITKMDMVQDKKKTDILSYIEDYRGMGYDVIPTSSFSKEGLDELKPYLKNIISVFAGQSGVGKSSLLNALKPELELKTNHISSHLGRGKHTTRHVELIDVEGGWVADTPGFSSLEFTELELEELGSCFPEFVEKKNECKFRGCLHLNEPKCAIKSAVQSGDIPTYRYEHYVQFFEEIKDRKPRY
ncbi:ribosome small subunit-dependent GTPase A [Bacillus spongiae]|uniref:Small ribosomal subunit biogenesis GTPase RsgA n=1 Tax=Bacillus spongiae TaxID=2683610 RepID=A0ABU8H9X9_9BACI